jgi:hypothetical protein
MMKATFHVPALALLLVSGFATADTPRKYEPVPATEPIKCYEIVWGSKENPGLGLTAGQAIELCSGATDAIKVVQCFVKAWMHPDSGGLGLTAGQAIRLCKTSSLQ